MKGQWHTIDELRKMEDPTLEDLPEGMGKQLLSQPNFKQFGEPGETFNVKPLSDGSSAVTKFKERRRR